jgi:extradiol dioxygenase family protein
MFGYVYANDDWQAASPDGLEALDTASQLQQTMRMPGQTLWKKCLVTIDRATTEIDIDFDYEGTKWVPDMADPERFALSLKPVT